MEAKKKKRYFYLLLIIILLILILGLLTMCYKKTDQVNITPTSSLDMTGYADNGEYSPENLTIKSKQMTVTDKVSSSALFISGNKGTEGSWVLENVQANSVIMQAEIVVNDNIISKSPPIYPAEHIKKITLNSTLLPGSYDAIAYINYFSVDTKEYISKVAYKIKVIID